MRRLVLLDRDGTINVEKHYLSSPDDLVLLPGAGEGIRLLRAAALQVMVVTNQSAVGRGYFGPDRLDNIHCRLRELLREAGTELDAIYVCPHRPDDGCPCRKPSTALARRAAADFGGDLAESFVVGDKACDVDLGRAVGATTVLVRTGYGEAAARDPRVRPDHVVADLLAAARLIVGLVGGGPPNPGERSS